MSTSLVPVDRYAPTMAQGTDIAAEPRPAGARIAHAPAYSHPPAPVTE
ncbi:hypothetical protein [Pseudactinotalea sp. Z1732]